MTTYLEKFGVFASQSCPGSGSPRPWIVLIDVMSGLMRCDQIHFDSFIHSFLHSFIQLLSFGSLSFPGPGGLYSILAHPACSWGNLGPGSARHVYTTSPQTNASRIPSCPTRPALTLRCTWSYCSVKQHRGEANDVAARHEAPRRSKMHQEVMPDSKDKRLGMHHMYQYLVRSKQETTMFLPISSFIPRLLVAVCIHDLSRGT